MDDNNDRLLTFALLGTVAALGFLLLSGATRNVQSLVPPGYRRATKDYYGVLGVLRIASLDEIKTAFRKLAFQCHPDHFPGDKTREARFKEINEAWEVLGDAQARLIYDRFGIVRYV
jgi:preprotein translocase subunit Sec63